MIINEIFKVVLLAAPLKEVSINNNAKMNSWFNITNIKPGVFEYNFSDILSSAKLVEKQIEKEYESIQDYSNIFLGGFSQGAILSAHIGLSFAHKLGGIIACSGFLCSETEIKNNTVNILALNGDKDELIDFELA